ncbi:MAG TPA: VanZ family protein [Bacillales bacterium]|nr:VanZ family protein [Bacillales bacterium]
MYLLDGMLVMVLGIAGYALARGLFVMLQFYRSRRIRWIREGGLLLFVSWMFWVISVTLFPIPIGIRLEAHPRLNLVPLVSVMNSIKQIGTAYEGDSLFMLHLVLRNVGGNFLLLLPLGFLAPMLWERMLALNSLFLFALVTTIGIETLQLLETLAVGIGHAVDIDDVIFNASGAVAGYFIYRIAKKYSKSVKKPVGVGDTIQ